jgi:hypothetical protein
VSGGCKCYYAPEFMAPVVSFDIEILQEPVLTDIDRRQYPRFTRSLVCHGPLRRPDGQFLPSQFSYAHWNTSSFRWVDGVVAKKTINAGYLLFIVQII